MPRPHRARRVPNARTKTSAPAPQAPTVSENAEPQSPEQERGRRRTTRSTGASMSKAHEDSVLVANRTRDMALERLDLEESTTASGNNNNEDTDSGSSIELGRRIMATPVHRRDTSGLDLGDSVFGDLDDSFEVGSVPRGLQSADNSVLSVSHFRRRPRASSIIGRNDAPARPSSRGGATPSISTTLNLGNFRRRRREPSILGTGRKPLLDSSQLGNTGLGGQSDSEDEDDFAPEAESTPLNNRRRTQPVAEPESEAEPELSPEVAEKIRSKKRKSEDAALSNDRPEKMSRMEVDEPEQVEDSESDSDLSELASPLGPPPALPERPVTPVHDDEVMAPPASSGSEADDVWPDIRTLAKRRRRPSVTTPIRGDNFSDISSPPSLTHSPNHAEIRGRQTRGRTTQRRQRSPEITTAVLTSMLPKRRYKKNKDEFDLDSEDEHDTTGLGDGEDELSYVDSATARRGRGSRPPSRANSRPASRGGRAAHGALQTRQVPASSKAKSGNVHTYSRRLSDKENDEEDGDDAEGNEDGQSNALPNNPFEEQDGEPSSSGPSADELKQAKKKFQEVDQWELDFEEDLECSSPQDAR